MSAPPSFANLPLPYHFIATAAEGLNPRQSRQVNSANGAQANDTLLIAGAKFFA
jgi:hypothetical protein